MSGDHEKCSKLVDDDLSAVCSLSSLCKRSQLDFEIEFYERILSRDPNYLEVLMNLGELFSEKGCYRRALQVDLRLAQLKPRCEEVHYNLACTYAMLNHKAAAIEALREAISLGFSDVEFLMADSDLAGLQDQPEFHRVVSRLLGRVGRQHVL
jgi:tetratricopeptide (TPR) repeat protein